MKQSMMVTPHFILARFWGEMTLKEIAKNSEKGSAEVAGLLARLATSYAKAVPCGLAKRLLNYVEEDKHGEEQP